ncbi:MAG: GYD domain-containing protein [Verrucomicrobiales bacterium]|nr:GYD domain-containing protein [Verrucomicrobiales bacterium]
MFRYVSLLKFTEHGAREMEKSPRRAAGFVELAAPMGVMVESQWWTTGAYDGVLILTGRSEEAVLGALSKLAAHGYVRTESMRAFSAREMLAITDHLRRPEPKRSSRK